MVETLCIITSRSVNRMHFLNCILHLANMRGVFERKYVKTESELHVQL